MSTLTDVNVSAPRRLPGRLPRVPRGVRRRINPAYLFIAPSVVIICVFILEPIIASAWISLHNWALGSPTHTWVGFDNYTSLFGNSEFWEAIRVTVEYTAVTTVVQLVLGLAVALRLRRTTWYSALARTAYFFPFIISLVVVGVIWRFLLDPQIGLVDAWLRGLGLSAPDWLQSTSLALPTVIFVGIWKNLGFDVIVFLAGLQQIPAVLYEAATLDGANGWQRFRYVTLPALRPVLLFATVLATITGLQLFDLVYAMTDGGPVFATQSAVMYLYQEAFVDNDLGSASAVAWCLFIIILAVSLVQLRLFRERDAA